MAIFGGWSHRQRVAAKSCSLERTITHRVRNWWPPTPTPIAPLKFFEGVDFSKFNPLLQKIWSIDFDKTSSVCWGDHPLTRTEDRTEKSGLDYEGGGFENFENRLDGHYKAVGKNSNPRKLCYTESLFFIFRHSIEGQGRSLF